MTSKKGGGFHRSVRNCSCLIVKSAYKNTCKKKQKQTNKQTNKQTKAYLCSVTARPDQSLSNTVINQFIFNI